MFSASFLIFRILVDAEPRSQDLWLQYIVRTFQARLSDTEVAKLSTCEVVQQLVWPTYTIAVYEHTYYVKPEGIKNDSCQGEPCHTFSQYLQNAQMFFTSETQIRFMGGIHLFDIQTEGFVTIRDISNLALTGNEFLERSKLEVGWQRSVEITVPTTKLQCSKGAGFAFINVTNFQMINIAVNGCGTKIDTYHWSLVLFRYSKLGKLYQRDDHLGIRATLLFLDTHNITIQECSIHNSTGYGLLGINFLGNSKITNSTFIYNNYHRSYKCKYKTDCHCQGGNILFVFAELIKCPEQFQQTVLSIFSTQFLYGWDVRAIDAISSDYYITGGSGIGIQITPVSFAVEVILDNITSAENEGTWIDGTNVCIRAFDLSHNFVIRIRHLHSIDSHPAALHPYKRSKAFGYRYGIHLPTDFKSECSTTTKKKTSLCSDLHIINSKFSYNSATAIFLQLESSSINECTNHITIGSCNITYNSGAIGSALYISQNMNTSPYHFEVIVKGSRIERNFDYYDIDSFHTYPNPPTSIVTLKSVQNITFIDCIFRENIGTALHAFDCTFSFEGNIEFSSNSAVYGGAMALHGATFMYLSPFSHVHFFQNHADKRGGAIYVSKRGDQMIPLEYLCFVQYKHISRPLQNASISPTLSFNKNTAEVAGTALYGGSIDNCIMAFPNIKIPSGRVDPFSLGLFVVNTSESDLSPVSSDPVHLCFCEAGIPNYCTDGDSKNEVVTIYPGEEFRFEVATAGQMYGLVPAVVFSTLSDSTNSHFGELQETQQVANTCTYLTFTVFSSLQYEYMEMRVAADELAFLLPDRLTIDINIQECPSGFALSPDTLKCDCAAFLKTHNITCNINDKKIERRGLLWISISHHSDKVETVVIHNHCPFDFCTSDTIRLHLNNSDEQCIFNHSGILCGACKPGLSLVLGNSQCLKCSNLYLFLTVAFMAAGLLLVGLIITLNLTVSMGTLNGLVFYVNVVRINSAIFFPPQHNLNYAALYKFLKIFVAWMNIDLGIETCLYDGMDSYTRTWLQFVFPVYIWIIVGIIIYLSRHSSMIVKLVGRNAIPVLATLFLLSYAKLQRTIISVLSFTYLTYENGELSSAVWLSDGNVTFLRGKHIALAAVALGFALLFITPFTLILLFSPCLRSRTGYRLLKWVTTLLPIFDAYEGPYKHQYRYWTGLMLVMRSILFATFSVNILGDPQINLLVIVSAVFCLLALVWQFGSVYKSRIINLLESSFILNLGILSTWSLFQREDSLKYQAIVTSILVGIAFVKFLLIVCYHISLKLKEGPLKHLHCCTKHTSETQLQELTDESVACQTHAPTTTFIELRESLLTDS